MQDRLVEIDAVKFRQIFPWIHLLRAFRIAVDVRKIVLGGLAVVALASGNRLFLSLPFAPDRPPAAVERWPWQHAVGAAAGPLELIRQFPDDPAGTLMKTVSDWSIVLEPVRTVLEPALILLRPGQGISEIAFAWTQLLWALVVWALFAGAITRMAAVQFARDSSLGLVPALRFSAENFLSFLAAPLLAAVGIGIFWILCWAGGLLGRIPVAGDLLVGIFWFVPLVFGFVMALILLGATAGWPLMYATISVEASDGYDGFSRAYGYVYGKVWHYVGFLAVAMAYGSVVIFFVSLFGKLAVYLAGWSIAAGLGHSAAQAMLQAAPRVVGGSEILGPVSGIAPVSVGGVLVGVWLHLVSILVVGFVYSYFWTASTIVYFLLRKCDDSTSLGEVYLPEDEEEDDLLPLVGAAASRHPVVERPHAKVQPESEPDEVGDQHEPGDKTAGSDADEPPAESKSD